MHVWLITVGEPIPLRKNDGTRLWRTGLLSHELARRGHTVTWWTSSVNHFKKEYFVTTDESVRLDERIVIQFLHGDLYKKNVSFARVKNHIQIANKFKQLARKSEIPDVIVCSLPTLELADEAVKYGNENGIPVFVDIRDRWPDELLALLPGKVKGLGSFFLAPMYRQARRALAGATGVLAISSGYLNWGLHLAGRKKNVNDAIFTHGYPKQALPHVNWNTHGERLRSLGVDASKYVFWFIGTFVGSIDLKTVIEAAALLQDHGRTDVQFVLSGSGQDDEEYRRLAEGLNNVIFTGWVDTEEIVALSGIAWAGLAAYKKGALMSLTNKLFEYMAAGIPILTSLPGEAADLIEKADCGAFYSPNDPKALEMQVYRFVEEPELRNRQALNAAKLFEQYSAEVVYKKMSSFLENQVQNRGTSEIFLDSSVVTDER